MRVGQGFEYSLRTIFYRSYGLFQCSGHTYVSERAAFGSPGHEIGNDQIEPLTDYKTV
jgi:hypothetical protein